MTDTGAEPSSRRLPASAVFDGIDLRRELKLESADSLFEWLKAGAKTNAKGATVPALSVGRFGYRGQSNAAHGLTSSLYRLCREIARSDIREVHLAKAEAAIVDAARAEGVGRLMSDLELLQVLQHHGIPTRLIDVSTAPLEALWMSPLRP